ncbi:hypothetical protein, partial [Uliginosibacterium gangwonense]|uniref:hypothetical protein n=1 Tax=Uliginosibacterium gangwonense TaxID=392736 RepID=UPI001B7F86B5
VLIFHSAERALFPCAQSCSKPEMQSGLCVWIAFSFLGFVSGGSMPVQYGGFYLLISWWEGVCAVGILQ